MASRSRNIAPAAPGQRATRGAGSAFGTAGQGSTGQAGPTEAGRPGHGRSAPARGPEAHPTSRRALKNWRVRSRLLLLITIPTLTAVALGGIRIASSVQSALAYQRILQLTTLSSNITVLAQRLEDERDQTVYYIARSPTRAGSAGAPRRASGWCTPSATTPSRPQPWWWSTQPDRRLVPGADPAGGDDRAVRAGLPRRTADGSHPDQSARPRRGAEVQRPHR